MMVLLQKDLRLYRPALFAFAAVMAGPYLVGVAGAIIAPILVGFAGATFHQLVYDNYNWIHLLENCSGFGILGTILLAAIYGGGAFAIERRERWADFLAMMPVSKGQIVFSKCCIAFGTVGLAWLTHVTVYAITSYYTDYASITDVHLRNYGDRFLIETAYTAFLLTAAPIVMVFGLAWLVSALIKSPSISAGVAIMVFLALTFYLQNFLSPALGWRRTADALFIVLALSGGFIAFVAGTICYLKRVSP
jgi:ABC-type transport system involved in multi-copper enzyme maturation permease subunit